MSKIFATVMVCAGFAVFMTGFRVMLEVTQPIAQLALDTITLTVLAQLMALTSGSQGKVKG